MATAGKIVELLDSLSNTNQPNEVLESLQTLLGAVHPSALKDVIPNVSFAQAFECLRSNDKELAGLCCDVLNRLLSAVSPTLVLHNFTSELAQCLVHPNLKVTLLALNLVAGVARENIESLYDVPEILLKVATLLGDDSVDVAKVATIILTLLGKTPLGLAALYSQEMDECLQQVMTKNDTARFRVYEIVVSISRFSHIGLQKSTQAGYIQQLVNEIHKEDILVQLNCLELLSDLAQEKHGLIYLDQQGVVSKMEDMISNLESDPIGTILLPGLMKFFGGLARFHPTEVCGKFNKFTNVVFESVEGGDQSLRLVAIDTIAFIGSTPEGKLALSKLGPHMDSYMKTVGSLIQNSVTDIRTRSLQATASLIYLQVEDQTSEMLDLTENWFSRLSSKPFELLFAITRQPFTDLRCSTFGVFQALALQPWGQRLMNDSPGFNEFLLDRSSEHSKEEKDAKYSLVETLVKSRTFIDVFGRPFYVRVMDYYHHGAFFIQTQSEVALEDGGL